MSVERIQTDLAFEVAYLHVPLFYMLTETLLYHFLVAIITDSFRILVGSPL